MPPSAAGEADSTLALSAPSSLAPATDGAFALPAAAAGSADCVRLARIVWGQKDATSPLVATAAVASSSATSSLAAPFFLPFLVAGSCARSLAYTCAVRSCEIDTMNSSAGSHATPCTYPVCPPLCSVSVCCALPLPTFHTMLVPSTQPEKSASARGDHARSYTSAQCPRSIHTIDHSFCCCCDDAAAGSPKAGAPRAPRSRSRQRTMTLSSPADASVTPSGQKRTTFTVFEWCTSDCTKLMSMESPLRGRRQRRTSLSFPAVAMSDVVGDTSTDWMGSRACHAICGTSTSTDEVRLILTVLGVKRHFLARNCRSVAAAEPVKHKRAHCRLTPTVKRP